MRQSHQKNAVKPSAAQSESVQASGGNKKVTTEPTRVTSAQQRKEIQDWLGNPTEDAQLIYKQLMAPSQQLERHRLPCQCPSGPPAHRNRGFLGLSLIHI